MSERFPPAKSPLTKEIMRKLLPKPPKPTPECASQQKRIPGSEDPVRTGSAGQKECLSVSHRAFAPRGCNAQHTQQQSYELMAQAAGKAEQGAELGAVGKFIGAAVSVGAALAL